MGKRIIVCVFVLMFAVILKSVPAFAEVKFSSGASLEVKHEYWGNVFDMNDGVLDNRNFFVTKTSPWGQIDFGQEISLYARLLNQFTAYTYYAPSVLKSTGQTDKSFHFDIDEVIFDNLYFDVRNLLGLPLDLRLGRQDFVGQYGEGFLIFIGTPQDGPRTAYFNALKLAWRMNDKNNLDFIYINNPRDDIFLPVINENNAPQALNTTDEEGYVLYWKNNDIANLALEGYYIYKREDDDGGVGLQAQKGKINALGSFVKYNISDWVLRGQFAYQFGDYGNNDRRAFGGYTFVDRDFKDCLWSPQASLGFIYLSGDK